MSTPIATTPIRRWLSGESLSDYLKYLTESGVMPGNRWAYIIGHPDTQVYKIEVGGAAIDRVYDNWLEIWQQLTTTTVPDTPQRQQRYT